MQQERHRAPFRITSHSREALPCHHLAHLWGGAGTRAHQLQKPVRTPCLLHSLPGVAPSTASHPAYTGVRPTLLCLPALTTCPPPADSCVHFRPPCFLAQKGGVGQGSPQQCRALSLHGAVTSLGFKALSWESPWRPQRSAVSSLSCTRRLRLKWAEGQGQWDSWSSAPSGESSLPLPRGQSGSAPPGPSHCAQEDRGTNRVCLHHLIFLPCPSCLGPEPGRWEGPEGAQLRVSNLLLPLDVQRKTGLLCPRDREGSINQGQCCPPPTPNPHPARRCQGGN